MSWRQVPVRRVFRLVNGGTPTSEEENWDGDVPWATPVDLGNVNGGYLSTTLRGLTSEGVRAGSRAVPAGSLVLSIRAPIGYVAQLTERMAFNQGCRGLVPATTIDPRYFRYQLLAFSEDLSSRGAGSTFMELSTDALAAAPIMHPPLEDQRRIADFLDAETTQIDWLAAARRQMRDLLTLKRERTVERILGLGSSPQLIPLKYVVRSVSVGIVITPARWYVDGGGIPALRGLNVQPGRIDSSDLVQISYAGHLENLKSRLSAGHIVVVRTGQAGVAATVPDELDGFNCIDLLIIRPGERVSSSFLTHFLNSYYAQDKVLENSVGSIQSHFNVGAMRNLGFPALELEEQERRVSALDEIVGDLDLLDEQLEDQLELLTERRQALIAAAVTGQIDVTTARGVVT